MIYLIDRGFRIKSALNILVNQCKYPGIYNECFCLNCSRGGDKDKDKDKDNDLRSSFANNVNDNDNDSDNDIDNDNQGTCFADDLQSSFANNDNDNVNDNVNNLRSSFANNDNDMIMIEIILYIYLVKNIKGVNLIVIVSPIVLIIVSAKRFNRVVWLTTSEARLQIHRSLLI